MTFVAAAAVFLALLTSRGRRRARLQWRRPVPRPNRRAGGILSLAAVAAVVAVASMGTPVVLAASTVVVGVLVRRRGGARTRVPSADLALTADVLGGCLASGAPVSAAVAAAGVAGGGQVAAALADASAALARGEDPAATWQSVETRVPGLAAVARLCARAATTGASTADELHRVAASLRAEGDVSRRHRLQRASVWLVLPLGLCFLPAFVLVGVVPLIVATLPGLSR